MKNKEKTERFSLFSTVFLIFLTTSHAFLALAQNEEPALTGRDVMILEDERPDGDDRRMVMTMRLVNRRGRERVRTVESLSKDYGKDKKSVMIFREPADVRGTMFLSWEYDAPEKDDDKWLYMPAMKKVRRISGASRNEYFMGTDYTYDDMGDRHVDEDKHTLLGSEQLHSFSCWKVESIPLDAEDMYSRKVVWLDKNSHLIIKGEYYDKDGLVKIYRALDIRQQDGIWTTFRSEMDNVTREHKTIMEIDSIAFNTGVDDTVFRVATIQRGRLPL